MLKIKICLPYNESMKVELLKTFNIGINLVVVWLQDTSMGNEKIKKNMSLWKIFLAFSKLVAVKVFLMT
jgi:hypothetical protein